MNESNGASRLSEVILLKHIATRQNVRVINNPFAGSIAMTFDKAASRAHFQLMNAFGGVVAEKVTGTSAGYVKWELPTSLPKGTYILKVVTDGQMFTSKLIRE
jgi:hypothetical protein